MVDLYKCPTCSLSLSLSLFSHSSAPSFTRSLSISCLSTSLSLSAVPLSPVSYCPVFCQAELCVCLCVDKVKLQRSVMCKASLSIGTLLKCQEGSEKLEFIFALIMQQMLQRQLRLCTVERERERERSSVMKRQIKPTGLPSRASMVPRVSAP